MSKTLRELTNQAIAVKNHYDNARKESGKEVWNVQNRMSGLVGDVGALSKLIMMKHGLRGAPENIDELLAHELSDCLFSVMVIAKELNIDLEEAFSKTTGELHARIERGDV